MPRVKPHYAVKCNMNQTVLEVIASMGLGFDCASKKEIQTVLALDVEPSRIIYAHPTKPASHLRYAATVDVPLMTFDNNAELTRSRSTTQRPGWSSGSVVTRSRRSARSGASSVPYPRLHLRCWRLRALWAST